MASFTITINNKEHQIEADPSMPLLWVLRDLLELTGTKYGCGKGLCGACTVHMEGRPIRSCSTPVNAVSGKITTIEGISDGIHLHPVQKAWIDHQVPQCGFCQSGQIMSAVALLEEKPNPSEEEIKSGMAGNICRCGTYPRIIKSIKSLSDESV